jgi:hypothetical protein
MKYLKKFESSFFSGLSDTQGKRKYFDRKIIEQLILDLTDIGFSIDLIDPNLKNMMRPCLNIIYTPSEKAESFKLGDVKETISLISNYMVSEEYFIDDIDVHGPNFRNFRRIDISKDTNEWDDNQELVQMIIYFDCDVMSTRNYEHLKKYEVFESIEDYERIHLDVVNYFTWEWKSKISESIKVERDLGYQSIFTDEFINIIKDICLELIDKDYNVYINECDYYRNSGEKLKSIAINIDNNRNIIDNEIFKSVVLNIKDFCEYEELKIDIEMSSPYYDDYSDVDDFLYAKDSYMNDEFKSLSIIIYQPLPQQ